MTLTVDGRLPHQRAAIERPDELDLLAEPRDPFRLPIGQAREISLLDFRGLLQADEDFEPTVRMELLP